MAEVESKVVETELFISRASELIELADAMTACAPAFHSAIALLYAPHKCFLATVNNSNRFQDKNGEVDTSAVFEARVFNKTAELRWLNKENGKGEAVVLSEDSKAGFFGGESKGDDKIYAKIDPPQTYLVWGQSFGASDGSGWTRFAEARICAFFLPLAGITENKKERAQFTAVEYLGEYEDGNIAIVDERLTGIEGYKGDDDG